MAESESRSPSDRCCRNTETPIDCPGPVSTPMRLANPTIHQP